MTREEYNNVPVFYCKNCLSLKIRDIEHVDNSEYCDECGSTNIGSTNIEEWEALHKAKYRHKFLDKY